MFDFIVVGAGSAGCAIAGRLSENAECKVLLLEAGPNDKHPMVHMPGGAAEILKSNKMNWQMYSVPQQSLNNRSIYVPRGKLVGGSSSLNGMVYIRGHKWDYDHWSELGNAGWSFAEVLPYFKRSEDNVRGESLYHGAGGPLKVSDAPCDHILYDKFISAGKELGYRLTDDFNGAEQEGFARYQATLRNGKRSSSGAAFLTPAVRARPNLTIVTDAHVTRLVLSGSKVVGLEYKRGRRLEQITVKREVILSAGAMKSPHILQMSGIGRREDLERAGIKVLKDLPGVGHNLQEHQDLLINYGCTKPITFNPAATRLHLMAKTAIDYFVFNKGIAACNLIEAGSFVKSSPDLAVPDIQMHFIPILMHGLIDPIPKQHGVSIHACHLRPQSRGSILPANADPLSSPLVDYNFLDNEYDWKIMQRCYEITRDIADARAWDGLIGDPVRPDARLTEESRIRDFIRQFSETVYHPVGSCKMGNDEQAVVDNELRVRGIEGLRVADASIMPTLIGGNTNAPCMMIGEKCADLVRGKKLPAEKI
ncbi:MAG TPA: choline dehydrogenase [Pseudomonadales bacterium]|nr:choline dehydrogenase [Pseudomonadales bacterium]